ncbi:MAG TPA: PorP/SprF family type IX secretion system membrane protein [Saprospiraceae bacterium]|jgi:type IX secretion system PorP/SprF family membrane protein|nr:PorP/SprF family type IX secretion system membrane protein [Saprospiraceae bacterium]HRO08069.1 PorP/SprF family type IX secretion system membrane protein [Saprospiraceae bacterium]HRP41344.1 PorP/SprF family type IX secretion system membrane protein [Saprospiraceae bacterium]
MKTGYIYLASVLFFVIAGFNNKVHGQARYFDERYIYTQANLSPQLINPGAYGANMDHNILVNYRNKWSGIDGAPRTITLAYNGAVGNRLGLGVNIMSDKFGELETFKGGVGLSYTIQSESNHVGFGISADYIKHGLAGLGNAVPGDPIVNGALEGAEYFEASFGVYGVYLNKLTYGLVLPSLINARISDIDVESPSRELGFILQFGYKVVVHPDISLTPNIIMKKLNNVPTHIDLNLNFGFLQDKLLAGVNYTLGADKRLGFLLGTKIDKFNFYYSYNTSSHIIQDYNNGSHELTIGVNFGGKKS